MLQGFSQEEGGAGDPSPWTARGVFNSIVAGCERKYGSKDLNGKHISVQGVGHVGLFLVEMLKKAGCQVSVSDTKEEHINEVREKFDVEVVSVDQIYDIDCDVYAPCAIGQTVNPDTIPRLKCDIIGGAANNQLLDSSVYPMLNDKGIMYLPDFVINSGGVISVGGEYVEGGWNETWVTEKVKNIYNTTHLIMDESEKRGPLSRNSGCGVG